VPLEKWLFEKWRLKSGFEKWLTPFIGSLMAAAAADKGGVYLMTHRLMVG
jgi:hypothetical protein